LGEKEIKFFGVIFDSKLGFVPHIAMLREVCLRALDVIEVVAGTNGERMEVLFCICVAPWFDQSWTMAVQCMEQQALDAVHQQGLRLCTGAYQTSPVASLYVEANEPPLDLRRIKLLLQYIVKLKTNPGNPAFDCVFNPQLEDLYDKNKNAIKSIGLRVKKHLYDSSLNLDIAKPSTLCNIPPW
jgi:hypothetical protein